jgi:hypothetical protein
MRGRKDPKTPTGRHIDGIGCSSGKRLRDGGDDPGENSSMSESLSDDEVDSEDDKPYLPVLVARVVGDGPAAIVADKGAVGDVGSGDEEYIMQTRATTGWTHVSSRPTLLPNVTTSPSSSEIKTSGGTGLGRVSPSLRICVP